MEGDGRGWVLREEGAGAGSQRMGVVSLGPEHAGRKEAVDRGPRRGLKLEGQVEAEASRQGPWCSAESGLHPKGGRGQESRGDAANPSGLRAWFFTPTSSPSAHPMDGAFCLGTMKQPDSPTCRFASWRDPFLLSRWIDLFRPVGAPNQTRVHIGDWPKHRPLRSDTTYQPPTQSTSSLCSETLLVKEVPFQGKASASLFTTGTSVS